jgi:enterobactin synthetase component D / holo-[acyl-carrier protein] synthase
LVLDNRAQLAAELAAVFPVSVIAADVSGPVSNAVLTPAELQSITHCAEKRLRDFAAGRACAHRALEELGIAGFSLLSGAQREPLWPQSIVGSITHTNGYAAAVVARASEIRSVGVDCEIVDAVREDLWPSICTPTEIERLKQLPAAQQQQQAALIFAAKEAFYKCQFPLTRAWVGFEEVLIEPLAWPAATGTFRVVPQKTLPLDISTVSQLVCRFRFHPTRVIAGVTLP